ncbi:hypothetical protein DZF97_16190, partial [Clavibacter nebraskensis]
PTSITSSRPSRRRWSGPACAAVGDGGRGIAPPCGRCRQVMLDLQPGMRVAVPGVDGPEMVAIRDLLPVSYARPDA